MIKRSTQAEMRALLRQTAGIDFAVGFHTLRHEQLAALEALAEAQGFRKPARSSESTARCFFAYLNRGTANQDPGMDSYFNNMIPKDWSI